ncbi:hypothetical protein [Nocardia sp. NPDC059691]|uniref:hypothetical protein n=1 Tax=Nocardia sp. NPDC059691 TaxID=3346908 RepID=UPI0036B18B85
MAGTDEGDSTAKIIAAVLSMLESHGYDAVQLRAVARSAHVSMDPEQSSDATDRPSA